MRGVDDIADLEALRIIVHGKVPSHSMFRVLNTRLMIQTGVDLDAIRDDQRHDPALLERVAQALARMGILVGPSSS